jgi:hypothetical protein
MKTRYFLAMTFTAVAIGVFIKTRGLRAPFIAGDRSVIVYLTGAPYSADPIEYDSFYHHVAFRSVLGSLVSQYKAGEYTPEIAHSWTSENDNRKWTFAIRKNLLFEDGTPITPNIVQQSFNRIAILMNNRKSNSGLIEYLEGIENIAKSGKVSGITADDDSVSFHFTKPMPKALEKISFGLYGIVHPTNYDSSTGKWLATKSTVISSGPYRIQNWSEKILSLAKRSNYPKELLHPRPIEKIDMFWEKDLFPSSDIDIAMGSELTDPPTAKHTLKAGPPSYISFLRILSWRSKTSVVGSLHNRKVLRNAFYLELEKKGYKPIKSFFPLIIEGIRENSVEEEKSKISKISGKLVLPDYQQHSVAATLNAKVMTALTESLKNLDVGTTKESFDLDKLFREIAEEKEQTTWDIARYGTGILAADPVEDVKFMFRSKEGILLPDESGNIEILLNQSPINLQKINESLWKDAIIWPITHYSSGLYTTPEFDFSKINLILPPTSFAWIGWSD